jgi:hypothetical protein
MIREQLIEGVVHSYKLFEEKLCNSLKDEQIDIDKVNRLLIGLNENRKIIKRIFIDNPSLELYENQTREIIRKVRDNNDSYINLLEILAKKIFKALIMKEMSKEDIDRLFEGFKHTPLSLTESADWPVISEELIQKIQDEGTPALLGELIEQIIEESPEDYSEDWLNEFAIQYDLSNFPLRCMEAGAIIHSREIPSKIINLFDEMRNCYMFGLYSATIIFCRAILEECLKRCYKNKNPEIQIERIENMQINEILEKVDLPEKLKKEAREIRKED